MLVPEDGGRIRSFFVCRSWFRWGVLGVVLCGVSLAASVWMFALHLIARREVASLQMENEGLQEQVSQVAERIDEVAVSVALAAESEREARLLAGLEPVDPPPALHALGVGTGGPLSPSPSDGAPGPEEASPFESQWQMLDALERQVAQQSNSYKEAIAILTVKRDRLDRTPSIAPLAGMSAISSGFGWRSDPFTGEDAFHHGVDIRAPEGTPVLATAAGTIIAVEVKSDYGLTVVIDHGDGLETRYAHLSASERFPGEDVARGDVIGTVGNSGRSTGPHIHYEVRLDGVAQDPSDFLSPRSVPPRG